MTRSASPASTHSTWRTFAFWAFWVGVAFFAVYPACNWLGAQRAVTYPLYMDMELSIPLIPEFFWFYISMYVLFMLPPFLLDGEQLAHLGKALITTTIVSGIIFILVPSRLGYVRMLPDDPVYASIFAAMFDIDLPHNLVPSLHVIYSALISLSIVDSLRGFYAKTFMWGWLILLCLSTVLVHQHHVLDIISGLLLAIFIRKYYGIGRRYV